MRDAKEILKRYQEGTATDEECQLIERWWLLHDGEKNVELSEGKEREVSQAMMQTVNQQVSKKSVRKIYWLRYTAVAAAVLAVFLIGVYVFQIRTNVGEQQAIGQILPGTNKATLTYADGTTLALSDQQQGIVMGETVTYLDGTVVTVDSEGVQQLVLTTPKGGTYQAVLPDGTHVWLNAGSKLSYPSSFAGNQRLVELEGEAFFEVKRIASQKEFIPFLVKTKDQTVSVLGTTFNISAYLDDQYTKTTLASGIVEVYHANKEQTKRLSPGEQSQVGVNRFTVNPVDVETEIGWRYGYFNFDKNDVDAVLKQFSRWYDVDFVYAGTRKDIKLSGSIHRNVSAEKALAILEYFDLKYELQQNGQSRRIIVRDKQ